MENGVLSCEVCDFALRTPTFGRLPIDFSNAWKVPAPEFMQAPVVEQAAQVAELLTEKISVVSQLFVNVPDGER